MYLLLQIGRKKAWTQEEDEFLIKLVHKYGPQKWTVIAENMPGTLHYIQEEQANSADSDGTII